MILALALAVTVSAAPIDTLDLRHAEEMILHRQRISHSPETPDQTRHQIRQTAKACEAIGGEQARELFLLYGAMASIESEWSFVSHDSGIGWGPIALQNFEVFAAAVRCGVKCDTETQRKAVWQRFHVDRDFCIWLSVRHLDRLVAEAQGVVLQGIQRHNPKARHYAGDIVVRHAIMWLEYPPLVMSLR